MNIDEAIQTALVARLTRDPQIEEAKRNLILEQTGETLDGIAVRARREKAAWKSEQADMRAAKVLPASEEWKDAREAHLSIMAGYKRLRERANS